MRQLKSLRSITLSIFFALILLTIQLPQPVYAAALVVDTLVDEDTNPGTGCSLREAIIAANTNADYGGCTGVGMYGDDTISFLVSGTITLVIDAQLPPIEDAATAGTLTVNGGGNITIDANGSDATNRRAFGVLTGGDLTLQDLTIQNGFCNGSCTTYGNVGGGINNIGQLALDTVTIENSISWTGGGGLFNANIGTITGITNCTFFQNVADVSTLAQGGAIHNDGIINSITGTTFSNNIANNDGGGIYNDGIINTISNTRFLSNTTRIDRGGGIYTRNQIDLLTDSVFQLNQAVGQGGGIYGRGNSVVTISNCLFDQNQASDGGGFYNHGPANSISDTTFSNNTATNDGGGLFNEVSLVSLTGSTFSGNIAANNGGGICNADAAAPAVIGSITNTTISGNTAANGGGLYNLAANTITGITFATITENNGGGIFNDGILAIANSIVGAQSSGTDCAGGAAVTSGGYNLESATSCGFVTAGDLQNATPGLGGLANNGGTTQTHLPNIATSDAVDQIPPASCGISTDQRGVTRPTGTNCDIGAVEVTTLLAAVAVCNGNDLDVNITAGDFPFDITGGGPNLPQNGVVTGITTLIGPGNWTGVTVTETTGDLEAINLGDFSCPTIQALTATATCSGPDLNVTITAGDPNFDISANDPSPALQAQNNIPAGTHTLTSSGSYGTWTGITVTELGGDTETINLADVTCTAPPPVVVSGGSSDRGAASCNLNIDVEADHEVVTLGDQVLWTVLVTNSGSAECQGVQTYGTMPSEFSITDIETSRGNLNWDGGSYYWVELGTLAINEQVTVSIDSLLQGVAAITLPEGAAGQSAGQSICLTGYITDPVNDTDCVTLFPDTLPATGGEPVNGSLSWVWVVAAGILIIGIGAYVIKRPAIGETR